MKTRINQSIYLSHSPAILASSAIVGQKEGQGPLGPYFDRIEADSRFGQKSWESAESAMLKQCCLMTCDKVKINPDDLGMILCGDLLNQCTATSYAFRDIKAPLSGVYSACASFGEALALAAILTDGGYTHTAMAAACSHFCSAERQFRNPLPYGSQRTPSAQWTVTAAGSAILTGDGNGPFVDWVTLGHIYDAGIKDMANMGAAMAPAAYSTLTAHFANTGRAPDYYDAIITGDLGYIGNQILRNLLARDGIEIGEKLLDCGKMIYARKAQDAHAGGSGAGCCASVFCSYIIHEMRNKKWNRLLFAPTGALMSTAINQQGESIPAICHAIALTTERG